MSDKLLTTQHIARICHETIRTYSMAHDDHSVVPFDALPEQGRHSSVAGVLFVINNPEVTAEQVHEHWCDTKMQQGWKPGRVKDDVLKTNPCLAPFEELPAFQRKKDALFISVVRALIGE